MFKVEPFPKAIKPTDQFQEWSYWLANFEMAAEKAGTGEQRAKAIDLSLHIGEEIRRIIVAKGMLPKESSVESDFPFYDNITEQLELHFRGLTDESVDVTSFNAMHQAEKETALEFEMRLREMANRVNETNAAMIRTRYIEGLRDKAIKERAFVDGISLKEVVKMATRKEAIGAKQRIEFSPWNEDNKAPMVVAAVSQGPGFYRDERQSRSSNSSSYQPSREGGSANFRARAAPKNSFNQYPGNVRRDQRGGGVGNDRRCKRCGVIEHRGKYCPAENATCFKCGEVGHFKHMCSQGIRSIDVKNGNPNEVAEEIFD